jgi:hypothetical protein
MNAGNANTAKNEQFCRYLKMVPTLSGDGFRMRSQNKVLDVIMVFSEIYEVVCGYTSRNTSRNTN